MVVSRLEYFSIHLYLTPIADKTKKDSIVNAITSIGMNPLLMVTTIHFLSYFLFWTSNFAKSTTSPKYLWLQSRIAGNRIEPKPNIKIGSFHVEEITQPYILEAYEELKWHGTPCDLRDSYKFVVLVSNKF